MLHSEVSWLISRLHPWSHHGRCQLVSPTAPGVACVPRAEQRGSSEVRFGKKQL